jgi:hypothetical protein
MLTICIRDRSPFYITAISPRDAGPRNTNLLLVAHFWNPLYKKSKSDNDTKKASVIIRNPTNFALHEFELKFERMHVAGISVCIFYIPKNNGIYI